MQTLNETFESLNTTDLIIKFNDTLQEFLNDIINLTDLILENYDYLANMNTQSQSTKRRMDFSTLFKGVQFGLLNFLGNVEFLQKILQKETFEKIKNAATTMSDTISYMSEQLEGKSVNEINIFLRDKIFEGIKEALRIRIINFLNSEQVRNLYNSEALNNRLENLKKSGILKEDVWYDNILWNLTNLINYVNDTLNSNVTIDQILNNLNYINRAFAYGNIVKFLKSTYDLSKNLSGIYDYGNSIIGMFSELGNYIQEMFDLVSYVRQMFRSIGDIFGSDRLRLLSMNKEKEPKRNERIRRVE